LCLLLPQTLAAATILLHLKPHQRRLLSAPAWSAAASSPRPPCLSPPPTPRAPFHPIPPNPTHRRCHAAAHGRGKGKVRGKPRVKATKPVEEEI
ncbi:unnamed protein product, partial [Urochloa humidicola]